MRYHVLVLSLAVLLAHAQVAYPNNSSCGWGDQTYRATGDWPTDASGGSSAAWNAAEPLGVMQPTHNQDCEYAVTVRNLVAGKSYNWKVSIGGTMDVNWGCVGRGGPNCAFTADSTGSILFKIVAANSYPLTTQAAPAVTKSSTVAASTTKASTYTTSTTKASTSTTSTTKASTFTTSTTKASTVAASTTSAYQYVGCYVDSGTRDLSVSQSTSVSSVSQCYSLCQGYKYFAVQYSTQCFCGNTYGTYGIAAETDCNMNCTNGETRCGGSYRNSIYSTGANPTTAAPTTSSTTKASTSSTTKASTSSTQTPATTQAAQTWNGRVVMSHYMMGYAADNTADQTYFNRQCTLAKAVGIDVFIANIGVDSWTTTKMGYMLQAAQSAGMYAAFSFDMTIGGMTQDYLTSMMNQFGSHPAYYKYNGKPFVSTFAGGDQTWWSSWKAQNNVYFCPAFLGDISQAFTTYVLYSFIDCAFSWDAWGATSSNSQDQRAISSGNSMGKKYMAGVAPWFYVKWNAGKNWMYMDGTTLGDENIYATRWQQVIASGSQFVEVITWNDFSESSYIGPLEQIPNQNDASSVPSYVNNPIAMNHGGFYGMTAFYANYFKTGNGTPTKNTLYWHYRIHSVGQSRSNDAYGSPHFYWTPNDCVGIHAITLKTGATVTVQIGNSVSSSHTISNTLDSWCVPFNGATGAVKVIVNLNGAISTGSGGPDIQSSGNYYNFNMWSGSIDY
ncbi:hypothetical protein PROFUN_06144 [Planoprotostelium fungivorum]|uniref:WSC domain-containing protein n=1 Tax=Planoprotostelium fungivorum TaxID=1890364 RepID=A0A2P6NPH9_9EUKA|nr:hypothetical protein PROFUN_06144 [Planoprotostelium fungivorum]